MKKNIEWLKEEITEILLTSKKDGTNYFYYRDLKERIYNAINQLDEPKVLFQEENINIVLDDLKEHIKEQQSLSQNVGLAHTSAGNDTHYRQYDYVLECINEYEPSDDLQNLLVPKQEEVDRAYKDGYEKGREHTFYKGYLEGLTEGERKTNEYFESITEEPSYEQVQKYLSEHGIEVVEKEPETVADVMADFFKSLERVKEVMSMEVEELEE